MRLPRSRGFFLALTGLALAVVLLANAHLVYVASTSHPECVPHVRADGTNASASVFGDAKSSCGAEREHRMTTIPPVVPRLPIARHDARTLPPGAAVAWMPAGWG